ncbi:MAG: hypothetical protein J6P03_06800 [Opitutales bacterium]|nr:hypothetical protein [Opitutales bacterium]
MDDLLYKAKTGAGNKMQVLEKQGSTKSEVVAKQQPICNYNSAHRNWHHFF